MKRQTLVRDGLSLAWYDSGGSGMPILFQHGLCGDVTQTREAIPATFRLITLECRAHGASEPGPLENLSIASFGDDIAALITELGLGPVILGGISMGAAIATRLAVHRPDLVRALALVRPAWIAAAAPPNMQPNAEIGMLLAQMPADAARATFRASPTYDHLAKTAPDNLASLLSFFAREPITTTAALLQAIAADGPGITEPDLAALAMPTMVIGTSHDAIHPWSMATRLAALIPGTNLVEARPKSIDKPGYLADLHTALAAFSEEI